MLKKRASRRKTTKTKSFHTFDDGYELGDLLVKVWSSNSNPPKVYINGYRIHHGLVGAGLCIAGIICDRPAMSGLGARLAIDDIADLSDWLDFEHDDSGSYYQTHVPATRDGFGCKNRWTSYLSAV